MKPDQRINYESIFTRSVIELTDKLSPLMPEVMDIPMSVIVAGGSAVAMYLPESECRSSKDVDVSFSKRFLMPDELLVQRGDGSIIGFDLNFNSTLGLEAYDFEDRTILVKELAGGRIRLEVLEPNDLAISKMGRFAEHDQEDIIKLAQHGLLDPEVIKERANHALGHYIGNTRMVAINIRDAIELIERHNPSSPMSESLKDERDGSIRKDSETPS